MGLRTRQNVPCVWLIDDGVVSRRYVVVSCARKGVSVVRIVLSVAVSCWLVVGGAWVSVFFLCRKYNLC